MKKILLLISVMFLASCATQHVFNAEKANTYLLSHTDRPVHIQEALYDGKVAEGMNEEEVKICWGKPDVIVKRAVPDHEIIIWRYFEDLVVGYGPKRSMIRKKLSKEVTFRDGTVINCSEINYHS